MPTALVNCCAVSGQLLRASELRHCPTRGMLCASHTAMLHKGTGTTSLSTEHRLHLQSSVHDGGRRAVTARAGAKGFSDLLFSASQTADSLVASELAGVTPTTFVVVLLAGLATSLSPCTLSVLPLTIGYIGGYSKSSADGAPVNMGVQSISFAFGLATTLAVLGVGSSLLGKAYGQIGAGLPIAVSVVAILMGLNLLEVLPLQLPSLNVDVRAAGVPPAAQAYLAGLTFALAASPCSTPVLATLLAYVSQTRDPVEGGALLLAYTLGYTAPLLAAASATGAVKQLLALRQYSAWLTPASGVLLLLGGTYTLLERVAPA